MNNLTVTPGRPSEFSPAEKALFEFKKAGRLAGWEFNLPVAVGGHTFYIDLAHKPTMIALEIDGQQHDYVEQWLKDDYRDNLIRQAGWTIKRVDHGRVIREPERIVTWLEATVLSWADAKERVAAEREQTRISELRRKVHKRVGECAELAVTIRETPVYGLDLSDAAKNIATKVAMKFGKADNRDAAGHQAALEFVEAAYQTLVQQRLDQEEADYEVQKASAAEELREWRFERLDKIIRETPGLVWSEILEELRDPDTGEGDDGMTEYDDETGTYYNLEYEYWELLSGWGRFDGVQLPVMKDTDDEMDYTRWYVK